MKDCKNVFHNKLGMNLPYLHNKSAKHGHSSEILPIGNKSVKVNQSRHCDREIVNV